MKIIVKKIIEKDNLFNMTNLEQRSESTNKKFNKLLYEARVNKIWGNKFHLMAIISFLRRNIIIYGSFKNKITNEWYNDVNSVLELQNKFKNNERTGAHLIYTPLEDNNSDIYNEDIPSFGYFSEDRSHYVSLIPINENCPIFKPYNNLFK
jgi:hypothetical protein